MAELPEAVPAAVRAPTRAERDRAFREIYDAHFGMVYRVALRCGVPSSEVEDVAQQVFVVAHRRIGEEPIANVGGWLRGIAVRVSSERRRWAGVRRAKRWVLESLGAQRAAAQPTPEHDVEDARTREAVGEVLAKMSPKLREVLVLADLEELQPSEVAEALGIPVNTVRSRRRIARERFEELWAEQQGGGR